MQRNSSKRAARDGGPVVLRPDLVDVDLVYFVLKYGIFCYRMHVCFCCVKISFFSTMPRDWLGRTSPEWPTLCRVGRKILTQWILIARVVCVVRTVRRWSVAVKKECWTSSTGASGATSVTASLVIPCPSTPSFRSVIVLSAPERATASSGAWLPDQWQHHVSLYPLVIQQRRPRRYVFWLSFHHVCLDRSCYHDISWTAWAI